MILFSIIAIFITIPITVIGISDQNFDNAQYFHKRLLVTAITNTILIWFIMLLIHNHAVFLI
jgi:hypothetical protein